MDLNEYLEKKRMTQVAFASLIGVSKFHLNKIVHRVKTPSFKLLKKIDEVTEGLVSFKDFSIKEESQDEKP